MSDAEFFDSWDRNRSASLSRRVRKGEHIGCEDLARYCQSYGAATFLSGSGQPIVARAANL